MDVGQNRGTKPADFSIPGCLGRRHRRTRNSFVDRLDLLVILVVPPSNWYYQFYLGRRIYGERFHARRAPSWQDSSGERA